VGLGVGGWLFDWFNLFDAFVVVITIIDFALSGGDGALSSLQMLRLVRLFRIVESWQSMSVLLSSITKTLGDLVNFGLVLVLFMFIYTILGRQIFDGKMRDEETGERTRVHMDTFGWGLVMVFQVISPENWNDFLYHAVEAVGWGGAVYAVSLFLLGNLVVLSLFLAIMLGGFGQDEAEAAAAAEAEGEGDGEKQGDPDEERDAEQERNHKQLSLLNPDPGSPSPSRSLRPSSPVPAPARFICLRLASFLASSPRVQRFKWWWAEKWIQWTDPDPSYDDDDDDDHDDDAEEAEVDEFGQASLQTNELDPPPSSSSPPLSPPLSPDSSPSSTPPLSPLPQSFASAASPSSSYVAPSMKRDGVNGGVGVGVGDVGDGKEVVVGVDVASSSSSASASSSSSSSSSSASSSHLPHSRTLPASLSSMLSGNNNNNNQKEEKSRAQAGEGEEKTEEEEEDEEKEKDKKQVKFHKSASVGSGLSALSASSAAALGMAARSVHVITKLIKTKGKGPTKSDPLTRGLNPALLHPTDASTTLPPIPHHRDAPSTLFALSSKRASSHVLNRQTLVSQHRASTRDLFGADVVQKVQEKVHEQKMHRSLSRASLGLNLNHVALNLNLGAAKDKDKDPNANDHHHQHHSIVPASNQILVAPASSSSASKHPVPEEDSRGSYGQVSSGATGGLMGSMTSRARVRSRSRDHGKSKEQAGLGVQSGSGAQASSLGMELGLGLGLARQDSVYPHLRDKAQAHLHHQQHQDMRPLADEIESERVIPGRALCCLRPNSPIRVWANKLAFNFYFENFILLVILFSCVTMAMETPDLEYTNLRLFNVVEASHYVVLAVFVLEMVLKVLALGFVMHPGAYLRSGYNQLDFLIVLTTILSLSVTSQRAANGLNSLRALRPLRLLADFESTQKIIKALWNGTKSILNVVVLGVLLLLVFAIIGVQMWAGRMRRCTFVVDASVDLSLDLDACLAAGGIWVNPLDLGNWDDVFSALLMMFELSTGENWPGMMMAAVDAPPLVDGVSRLAPIRDYNQWAAVFFIVVVLVCTFFYANLFVGAILDAYEGSRTDNLSEVQSKWFNTYRAILEHPPPLRMVRPRPQTTHPLQLVLLHQQQLQAHTQDSNTPPLQPPPPSLTSRQRFQLTCHQRWWAFRQACYKLAQYEWTRRVMMAVVFLNSIFMGLMYTGMVDDYELAFLRLNDICSWVYVLECVMKLAGYGPVQYWAVHWHRYELVNAVFAVFDFFFISLSLLTVELPYFNPLFFRAFRVLRMFQLLDMFVGMRNLMQTLRFSLPAIYNVVFLLAVFYFVYAVAGMALFGNVRYTNYLNDDANFRTFPTAMVTLFRATTGENWNGLMRDCMISPPFCAVEAGDCGSVSESVIYWISFQLITFFILVKLVVAIVINHFEEEFEDGGASASLHSMPVTSGEIINFGRLWHPYSRGIGDTMPVARLPELFKSLSGSLATEGLSDYETAMRVMDTIPSDGAMVHYVDVLYRLCQRAFAGRYPDQYKSMDQLPWDHEKMVCSTSEAYRQYPKLRQAKRWRLSAGVVMRLLVVQRLYRGMRARKSLREAMIQAKHAQYRLQARSDPEDEIKESKSPSPSSLPVSSPSSASALLEHKSPNLNPNPSPVDLRHHLHHPHQHQHAIINNNNNNSRMRDNGNDLSVHSVSSSD